MKKGFDSELYLKIQSEKIEERIKMFDKLYLEFGGKIFDDYHAARVLPGFKPDAKIKLLEKLKDISEVIQMGTFVIRKTDLLTRSASRWDRCRSESETHCILKNGGSRKSRGRRKGAKDGEPPGSDVSDCSALLFLPGQDRPRA